MTIESLIHNLKISWTWIISFIGILGTISALIGYISGFTQWGNKYLFAFIKEHYLFIWLISLTLIIISIFYWVVKINKRFLHGFRDSFKSRLSDNWDYVGPWKITDDNILVVTGSDEGGITKKGSDWENYSLSFKAKITSSCLGVIVRARDLNNYYMIQINKKAIAPHYRVSFPQIRNKSLDPMTGPEIEMKTGWQVFQNLIRTLDKELTDWINVCVKVKGQTISMYINKELVFHEDSFLQIPKGKIGFRCHSTESSLIKDVNVKLL